MFAQSCSSKKAYSKQAWTSAYFFYNFKKILQETDHGKFAFNLSCNRRSRNLPHLTSNLAPILTNDSWSSRLVPNFLLLQGLQVSLRRVRALLFYSRNDLNWASPSPDNHEQSLGRYFQLFYRPHVLCTPQPLLLCVVPSYVSVSLPLLSLTSFGLKYEIFLPLGKYTNK